MAISPADLWSRRQTPREPTVLDVRSRWEFERGHVPGAVHAPFWRRAAVLARVAARPTDAPIVLYCGHGPRAWWAAYGLRRHGFTDVQCLTGHILAWRRAGLPEERP